MESTVSRPAGAVTAGSLRQAIAEFVAGQRGKSDIRLVLARALQVNAAYREAIQEFLDTELRARRLSASDHKELSLALDQYETENIPTEAAAETPDAPGIYRVDSEGTLILAEDFEPSPISPFVAPTDAARTTIPAGSRPDHNALKASALPKGTVLRERFRLDQEVARGSMGIVYRATDLLKLDAGANAPEVAVKVINPEFANDRAALKSFQNEVANTQHLSHPNIIHLFELDRDREHFFITMEWLDGEALDALLDRSRGSALPPVQAYAIIEQLCDALTYAHERNVVHADIKPGNVFLTKSGELKLIDFGIARFDESAYYGIEKAEEERAIALTPAYASCECLEKQAPTAQDDLFSLACLVYRLLSGRRVFGSQTALQAETEGLQPVPIGGISDQRWAALSTALSFRREHRQASVQAFADEFGRRGEPRDADFVPDEEEVPHTDTLTLQQLPDGVDFALHDTGKLRALEIGGGLDEAPSVAAGVRSAKRGSTSAPAPDTHDRAGQSAADDEAAAIDVEAIRAQALASLAQKPSAAAAGPINFFDDAADESVFIPIEEGPDQSAAVPRSKPVVSRPASSSGTGTAELEALSEQTLPQNQDGLYAVPAAAAAPDPAPAPKARPRPPARPSSRDEPPVAVPVLARPASRPAARASGIARAAPQSLRQSKSSPVITGAVAVVVVALVAMSVSLFTGNDSLPARAPVANPTAALEQQAPIAEAVAPALDASGSAQADADAPEAADMAEMPGNPDQSLATESVYPGWQPDTGAELGTGQQPAEPFILNTVDTGISRGAGVVPVPLGLPGPRPAPSRPAPTTTAPTATALTTTAPGARTRPVSPTAPAAGRTRASARPTAGATTRPAATEASLTPGDLGEGEQRQNALLARAELAVGRNDVAEATRLTDLAAANGADPARLQQTRSLIADLRKQNAWQAIATMDATAKDAGTPGTAGSQPVEADAPLPLSTFEFANYVEPVYPKSVGTPLEGWVDVSFTVAADGSTRDIEVIGTDLPARFAAPSIQAVSKWRFRPYERNGAVLEPRSAVRLRYAD